MAKKGERRSHPPKTIPRPADLSPLEGSGVVIKEEIRREHESSKHRALRRHTDRTKVKSSFKRKGRTGKGK